MTKIPSHKYWESRYKSGGTSGDGSRGKLLAFKSSIINGFIDKNKINTVIDFGCGDGFLARLINCPFYTGYDISSTAIKLCKELKSPTKTFFEMRDYDGQVFELALSIDVLFHLIEDEVFNGYLENLFHSASDYIIIYSSNHNNNEGYSWHIRHRRFTDIVERLYPEWKNYWVIKNNYPYDGNNDGSFCDFYFYKKRK